jgi:MarR family transcriptional regulator, 2-MHQ and catechol-resistance regulon repressor
MHDRQDESLDSVLLYNLIRTHSALTPYLDRGLRDVRITGAQLNALLLLREAGESGLALSEIGQRLVVTKANVTGLVDRLEREGLVVRDGHADRRVTVAKLTAKGAEVLAAALPRRQDLLACALGGLTGAEKELLVGLLTRLRRGLRQAGEGTR